jgi:hypothetical protein
MKVYIVEDYKRDMFIFAVKDNYTEKTVFRSTEWETIQKRYNILLEGSTRALKKINSKLMKIAGINESIEAKFNASSGILFIRLINNKMFMANKPPKRIYRKGKK